MVTVVRIISKWTCIKTQNLTYSDARGTELIPEEQRINIEVQTVMKIID